MEWKIRSSEKYLFGFNHSNYVVKTEFFKKEQSYANISYLLQQHTKLLLNRCYFNNVIQCFTFYIENRESFGSLTKNCPKLDKNRSVVS